MPRFFFSDLLRQPCHFLGRYHRRRRSMRCSQVRHRLFRRQAHHRNRRRLISRKGQAEPSVARAWRQRPAGTINGKGLAAKALASVVPSGASKAVAESVGKGVTEALGSRVDRIGINGLATGRETRPGQVVVERGSEKHKKKKEKPVKPIREFMKLKKTVSMQEPLP